MKFVIVLGDGMADYRVDSLENKTPLMVANKPNIDELAKCGVMGMVQTVPEGLKPGSDTANLSVMGYDPIKCYSGRSPLEAISMGLKMVDTDIAVRCNLVTLSDEEPYDSKTIIDYSAGEITTEEAKELIEYVQENLGDKEYCFNAGISYRHCFIMHNTTVGTTLTPPHDITGKKIKEYLPSGLNGQLFLDLQSLSYDILKDHPINIKRKEKGLNPANSIWLWGEGTKPQINKFYDEYGLKGAVVSAVDLIKGIGIAAGMKVYNVEKATGNYYTNYEGKADAVLKALQDGADLVYLHIEAPDECGHQGDVELKVKSIEKIDELVVKHIKNKLDASGEDYSIMILPDHPTPLALRTHTNDAVPFLIFRKNISIQSGLSYDEENAKQTNIFIKEGYKLMSDFIKNDDNSVFGNAEENLDTNMDLDTNNNDLLCTETDADANDTTDLEPKDGSIDANDESIIEEGASEENAVENARDQNEEDYTIDDAPAPLDSEKEEILGVEEEDSSNDYGVKPEFFNQSVEYPEKEEIVPEPITFTDMENEEIIEEFGDEKDILLEDNLVSEEVATPDTVEPSESDSSEPTSIVPSDTPKKPKKKLKKSQIALIVISVVLALTIIFVPTGFCINYNVKNVIVKTADNFMVATEEDKGDEFILAKDLTTNDAINITRANSINLNKKTLTVNNEFNYKLTGVEEGKSIYFGSRKKVGYIVKGDFENKGKIIASSSSLDMDTADFFINSDLEVTGNLYIKAKTVTINAHVTANNIIINADSVIVSETGSLQANATHLVQDETATFGIDINAGNVVMNALVKADSLKIVSSDLTVNSAIEIASVIEINGKNVVINAYNGTSVINILAATTTEFNGGVFSEININSGSIKVAADVEISNMNVLGTSNVSISGKINNELNGVRGEEIIVNAVIESGAFVNKVSNMEKVSFKEGAVINEFFNIGSIVEVKKLETPREINIYEIDGLFYCQVSEVIDAEIYEYYLNGNLIGSTSNVTLAMTMPEFLLPGKHNVTVRATNSNKEAFIDSDYATIEYNMTVKLKTPVISAPFIEDGKIYITINQVNYAEQFSVTINGTERKYEALQGQTICDITDLITIGSNNAIVVKAIHSQNDIYKDSDTCVLSYLGVIALEAPIIEMTINELPDTVTLSWEAVNNAKFYEIYINNSTTPIATTTSTTYTLPIELVNENDTFKVVCKKNYYYLTSNASNVLTYNKIIINAPVVTLDGLTVSFNGVENATYYNIIVNDEIIKTVYATEENVYSIELNSGELPVGSTVKVIALNESMHYNSDNATSNAITRPLDAPSSVSDRLSENNEYILTWSAVSEASYYIIKLNGEVIDAQCNVTSLNISILVEDAIVNGDKLSIQAVKTIGEGQITSTETSHTVTIIPELEEQI